MFRTSLENIEVDCMWHSNINKDKESLAELKAAPS